MITNKNIYDTNGRKNKIPSISDIQFSLPKAFIDKYKDVKPSWDALGNFVFKRTYSRLKYAKDKSLGVYIYETIDDQKNIIYFSQKDGDYYIYKKTQKEDKYIKNENLTQSEFLKLVDTSCEPKLVTINETEEFWETIQRVVEGCFKIQKWYCTLPTTNYEWKERSAKKTAQKMFEKMFNFKFLPAGRGLWMMGTPYMDKHGSMALNNCGFTTTENLFEKGSEAFVWLIDALMLGVGVGFDTKGGFICRKVLEPMTYSESDEKANNIVKTLSNDEIKQNILKLGNKIENIIKYYKRFENESDDEYDKRIYINYLSNEYIKENKNLERELIDKDIMERYEKLSEKEKSKYVIIKEPIENKETFVIPDSREGWVNSVRYLINAFLYTYDELKDLNDETILDVEYDGSETFSTLPTFDYSLIREKGELIRGFGGKASGPEPLKDLHNHLIKILKERIGKPIKTTDIVDIMNNIGRCVVSGNVRRSAEIAIFDPEDYGCKTMKSPDNLKYVAINEEWRNAPWASNNTVKCEIGQSYDEISDQIIKNGEPGILWLENCKNYSRMREDEKDYKDKDVIGTNPCFHPDTLIAVADGRNAVTIKQLAEEGRDVPVYSINEECIVEIRMGRNPRITGYDEELLKITLDDGTYLIVTPNHKMRLLNGEKIEANELKVNDSLPRFSKYITKFKKDGKDYYTISSNTLNSKKNRYSEHRLIMKFNKPKELNDIYNKKEKHGWIHGNVVVHHKDGNGLNNDINNLEILKFSDHNNEHNFYDVSGKNNPMYNKNHSKSTKKLIGQKTKERCQDSEYKEKLSKSIKKGMNNEKTRQLLSDSMNNEWNKYYEDFEKTTDLKTERINNRLYVIKKCESCKEEFKVPLGKRERAYCSISCANKKSNVEGNNARSIGQKRYFENKQRDTLHKQIMIYKNLQNSLKRLPTKKEWECECKNQEVSIRFNKKSQNESVMSGYKELQKKAISYNHRVAKIEKLSQKSNVYNITVDENHTIGVITSSKDNIYSGIFCFNCGEQSLCDKELCNLVETYPSNHETYEEYEETLELAALYGKSATLLTTHWRCTNNIMHNNRRIGVSQTGIIEAINKHGKMEMLNWCKKGYNFLRETDKAISKWTNVNSSNKISTVKPSGTISLLAGVSPGIHYPHAEYYIRRIRIENDDKLVNEIKRCGYNVYPDPYSKSHDPNGNEIYTTMIVDFPIKTNNYKKSKIEISLYEQIMNVVNYQKYWSDNQVSCTVTFKPEESHQIKEILETFQIYLKSISFLPLVDHKYENAPYETITKEKYEEMKKMIIDDINFNNVLSSGGSGEKYCSNESCEIKYT